MNAVGNNVGSHAGVGEHFADDAGITMSEWPHGIEGVGGVTGAGIDCGARRCQIRVGVSNAHANARGERLSDHPALPSTRERSS